MITQIFAEKNVLIEYLATEQIFDYSFIHSTSNTYVRTYRIQWDLSIKDTLNKGHLSNEDTVCRSNCIHRAVYKSTSELSTPLYTR